MMAILQGRLSLLLCLTFPVLLIAGFIMQSVVSGMRHELDMMEYSANRGPVDDLPEPPPKEELIPSYTMLTWDDYSDILEALQDELAENHKM